MRLLRRRDRELAVACCCCGAYPQLTACWEHRLHGRWSSVAAAVVAVASIDWQASEVHDGREQIGRGGNCPHHRARARRRTSSAKDRDRPSHSSHSCCIGGWPPTPPPTRTHAPLTHTVWLSADLDPHARARTAVNTRASPFLYVGGQADLAFGLHHTVTGVRQTGTNRQSRTAKPHATLGGLAG